MKKKNLIVGLKHTSLEKIHLLVQELGNNGNALEITLVANIMNNIANGLIKYSIQPLNCCFYHHKDSENLEFHIQHTIPIQDRKELETTHFIENYFCILPNCYPLVDFALSSDGKLILIQTSVMSLADHQQEKDQKFKTLSSLTNRELEKNLGETKKSKEDYVSEILSKINSGKINKEEIKKKHGNIVFDSSDNQPKFWDLLWMSNTNDEKDSIGNKLWNNAFGEQILDKQKVFLVYITTSPQRPISRKIDEKNAQVIVVGKDQLTSIFNPTFYGYVSSKIDTNNEFIHKLVKENVFEYQNPIQFGEKKRKLNQLEEIEESIAKIPKIQGVTLRKYGQKKGGKSLIVPNDYDTLLKEASKKLDIIAVKIRRGSTETEIDDIRLIKDEDVLYFTTEEDEKEFQ